MTTKSVTEPTFLWRAPGKPWVQRDLATTDTYLRMALGDSAKTTALLMELANGSREVIECSYNGVSLQCRKGTLKAITV